MTATIVGGEEALLKTPDFFLTGFWLLRDSVCQGLPASSHRNEVRARCCEVPSRGH